VNYNIFRLMKNTEVCEKSKLLPLASLGGRRLLKDSPTSPPSLKTYLQNESIDSKNEKTPYGNLRRESRRGRKI